MDIYKRCTEIMNQASRIEQQDAEDSLCSSDEAMTPVRSTIPSILKTRENSDSKTIALYYISDLHLVHHILKAFPNGASDHDVSRFIREKAASLFRGNFLEDVRRFRKPIVLFGGDIASVFSVAEIFYRDFCRLWTETELETYTELLRKLNPLREELKKNTEIIDQWKSKHTWTSHARKALVEYKSVPQYIKELLHRQREIENETQEITSGYDYNWEKLYKMHPGPRFAYSVLGNHEFWSFRTYEDCVSAYQALFNELHIHFLNSDVKWLGRHDYPTKEIKNPETGKWGLTPLSPQDDPKRYDFLLLLLSNAVIVGGTGYAASNPEFNAAQGIYGAAINEQQEKRLAEEWRETYRRASRKAKEQHTSLIVLTHMPYSDWAVDDLPIENHVFFYGHNHRNEIFHDDNNSFIFADNQVGYFGNSFSFKKALLHKPANPFAGDQDGFRQINVTEYKEFYSYVCDNIPGTGIIEKQIASDGEFYVIKHDDYYGFFTETKKGIFICNGGQVRYIDSFPIKYHDYLFSDMVHAYLRLLSPLRTAQESVSAFVKSFGGTGKIHGTIVDIDFYNHVMFNTDDGTITYYYAPFFGAVKPYSDILSLLTEQRPDFADRYLKSGCADNLPDILRTDSRVDSFLQFVDIKNSQYAVSRRVNALQRLFDKHILRDWNDDLLMFNKSLPQSNQQ